MRHQLTKFRPVRMFLKSFMSKCSIPPNPEKTIYRSKAVGEPPLMLGLCVFHALRDAVASVSNNTKLPRLDAPATPESVLAAVANQKANA